MVVAIFAAILSYSAVQEGLETAKTRLHNKFGNEAVIIFEATQIVVNGHYTFDYDDVEVTYQTDYNGNWSAAVGYQWSF